jgi:hypothetical protein
VPDSGHAEPVMKNIKLTERFNFCIGVNMYNVFNHHNFGNPAARPFGCKHIWFLAEHSGAGDQPLWRIRGFGGFRTCDSGGGQTELLNEL